MFTFPTASQTALRRRVNDGNTHAMDWKETAMIHSPSAQPCQIHGTRRGVVLVVVLAMLGLLAVIGVTFATYSNQSLIASRRFVSNTKANVDPDSLLNYALEQLINDTNNRLSSLRGHSLKRDMYGNDSVFHGILTSVPDMTANIFPKPQIPATIVSAGPQIFQDPVTGAALSSPARLVQTNIPVTGSQFDGYDFTRWVMRVAACTGFDSEGRPLNQNPSFLSQTVEVLNGAWHPGLQAGGYRALLIAEPDFTPGLAQVGPSTFFSLDGRYLRSFNGAGVTSVAMPGSSVVHDWGKYPNLRLNSVSSVVDPRTGEYMPSGMPTNPDLAANPGYDEDYDAADLENWFLALQSADGSITLPSFHRPGIITYDTSLMATNPAWYLASNDWQVRLPANPTATQMAAYAGSAAKFLRPRAADGHDRLTFPDLVPDLRPTLAGGTIPNPNYGQIGYFDTDSSGIPAGFPDTWKFNSGYDVDNDGDGYKESVWIDLGFPVQTDPNGKKYKPLFAFMVVGLNGRLPLNTAGNLHDRDIGVEVADRDFGPPVVGTGVPGAPQYNHASHLGTSPTEVNPKFALRNSQSLGLNAVALEIQSTLGLRGLLAGHRTGTTPILGRWGDEKNLQQYINFVPGAADIRADAFMNPVRAGKSMIDGTQIAGYTPPSYVSPDATDDDSDAFDFLNSAGAGPLSPTAPQVYSNEIGDGTYPSSSRNLLLSVERQRRYVTPTDPLGVGRIIAWNRQPLFYPNYILQESIDTPGADMAMVGNQLGAVSWFGNGADRYGRVGFFGYYRPPGISTPELLPPDANVPMNATDIVDFALHQFQIGGATFKEPGSYLNPTHGYESFRNPLMTQEVEAGGIYGGGFAAGMPYNFGNNWDGVTPWPGNSPTTLPYPFGNTMTVPNNDPANGASWPANNLRGTFTNNIGSDLTAINTFLPGVASASGLLNRDEADEQNLYDTSDQFDSPFRATDLADFYLADSAFDDTSSGNQIDSRIKKLAPEVFDYYATPQPNSATGATPEVQQWGRWPVNPRKLFAHESWDTNRFSWSNDNPGGVFGAPGSVLGNANFTANQSASSPNLSYNAVGNFLQFPTPSIALGDRRINLNFPLPAYDYQGVPSIPRYQEPTRLKWLRETYQLMLRVLPPKAVDTALEKAELAQFLVNVIDFRDPDGVMTLFTAIDPNTNTLGHGLYQTIAGPSQPSVIVEALPPNYAQPPNTIPLNLWGMEYQPVALNEVLAYEFKYWGSDGKGTEASQRRLFIEMVNTLTASNRSGGDVTLWDPSDQNMNGWDFVVAQDTDQNGVPDATGRPDPVTGQIPVDTAGNPLGKIGSANSVSVPVSGAVGGGPMPNDKDVKAMRWDPAANTSFPVYTVLANPPAPVNVEIQPPDNYVAANNKAVYVQSAEYDKLLPPEGEVTETEKGRYFWLYLRRPADPSDPASPKVVVDSIRFPYMISDGKSDANPMSPNVTETTIHLYSAQRFQPYRGGHAVANGGATAYFPLNAYGYSEQTGVSDARSSSDPNNHSIGYSGGKNLVSDRKLRHTIGTTNTSNEDWQLMVFNDRDFQSLGEIFHVPGVGPGRFTKMFVENNPAFGKGQRNPSPPTQPKPSPPNSSDTATASNNFKADEGDRLRSTPPTFPYLVDRFFYTAAPQLDYVTPYSSLLDQSGNPITVTVPPVLVPNANGQLYGSPSADGWHRMLEFLEVPSSMNGAIGPVTSGDNGDWYREMRVPGKINLNLVVDEEVFMGLIDDARLNIKEVDTTTDFLPSVSVGQTYTSANNQFAPLGMALPNRGYSVDPSARANTVSPAPMKRVFSDFLKLRHGGSGTILGFGKGQTGSPDARELPYRSLAYPDINYTILRPGALTPSGNPASANNAFATVPGFKQDTNGVVAPPSSTSRLLNTAVDPRFWFVHNYMVDTGNDPNFYQLIPLPGAIGGGENPPFLGNPGIRNILLDYAPTFSYAQPPTVPFRRLFQIPDSYMGFTGGQRDWDRNSNANLFGNPFVNQAIQHPNLSTTNTTFAGPVEQLDNQTPYKRIFPPASLVVARDPNWAVGQNSTAIIDYGQIQNNVAQDPTFLPRPLLGANLYQNPSANNMGVVSYNLVSDRREHPFFRTKMLEKLMNLTTVRTHQFAVYVTVGFFEVKSEGNANTLQPDILGPEIDANNRYRLFAVIDRTKAEGFNPINPGNYRDLVDYSRRLK